MENEGRLSSFDEYSQSTKSENSKTQTSKQQSSIYQLQCFPITTSPWIASASFLFQLYFVVHSLDFYTDNACKVFGSSGCLALVSQFIKPQMQVISFTLNIYLAAASFLALVFNKSEEEGYKYILGWNGSKIFPFLRYLIDINVAMAAIFLTKSSLVTFCFIITALTNLIINFFGQNYTLRKDYLCCKSMQYMMLLKISIIIGYALNCTGYHLINNSQVILIVFLVLQFITFVTLYICFFLFGFKIYRHTSTKILLILTLNIYCAVTLGNLFDAFMAVLHHYFVPNRNIILTVCFFFFLCFLSYSLGTRMKKDGTSINNKNSTKRIYFLFYKLENSSQNINDDCQVRGIIRHHLHRGCSNHACFVNQGVQAHYDSKKNKYCYSNKINQGKTSFIKLIAKCAYQQQLQQFKWNNTELLLEYIQFYYMKFKNLFKVTILLVELQKRFLTPFQRIRLARLRKIMKQQNIKLNQQLYNGCLDLQNLIISQNKFDEIQLQLKQVLLKNLQYWKYLQNDSINLSLIIKILRPNFLLIQKINNNWKCIAKYFDIQKIWKFMFVCYTLYIRNQKLKPQLLQQFGQSVHEQQLFNIESQHIDKTTQPNKLYIAKMIFEQDACCIHINHSQDKPVIKSVSRYFERIYGYNCNQIIQSSLQIMMSPCFRDFHKRKFLKWAGQGKSSRQSNYQVKKVFPVNKDGFIVATFKFVKQFLCENRQLQYVAMLKKNKEQQNVILLNDNYQIQGMTQSAVQKFELTLKQYQEMRGLNILIFVPSLIQYTKYQDERQSMSEQNIGDNSVIKSTTNHESGQKLKHNKINIKKQFTKNNVQFQIPLSFNQIKQIYINQTNVTKDKYNILTAINKCNKILKESNKIKKYKVQIQIRQKKMDLNYTYLEFYLREIQSNDHNNNSEIKSRYHHLSYQKSCFTNCQDKNINQQDINKFFQNSQSSQNISLAFCDNIFIKQDNNQGVQMISHVHSISLYVRIIFILFFGLLIGSLLFEYSNYEGYKQKAKQLNAIVSMQLGIFELNNKYHAQILNISDSKQTVEDLTQIIRSIRSNNMDYKKAILDRSINQPKIFSMKNSNNNKSQQYDQIDILDKMFQNIIQILYKQNGNVTFNLKPFDSYQAIVLPYIQQITTTSLDNISIQFDIVCRRMQIKNNIYIAIGLILLIVGFFLVFSSLLKITKSFVSLMQIFTQFSQIDLKKIIKYCYFLNILFNHLTKKYDQFKQNDKNIKNKQHIKYTQNNLQNTFVNNNTNNFQTNTQSTFRMTSGTPIMQNIIQNNNNQQEDQDNANLNKKVKKVQNGKQLTNLKLKSIAFVMIYLFLYGLSAFGFNLYTIITNQQIKNYKDSGYSIFKYYSAMNVYVLSMTDRAIYQDKYQPQRYYKYQEKVNQMKSLKQQQPIGLGMDFIQLRNNILFGNVCNLYPDVLAASKLTEQQCNMIAENNLQHGVQSFLYYMIYNVDFYLNSTSYQLNLNTGSQIQIGQQISNAYLLYLLNEWTVMFEQIINKLIQNIIIICTSLFIFQIIIYFILIQYFIVGNLKDKFIFFKKIYSHLVPDYIITKEKIIKAKLEVDGIIKK